MFTHQDIGFPDQRGKRGQQNVELLRALFQECHESGLCKFEYLQGYVVIYPARARVRAWAIHLPEAWDSPPHWTEPTWFESCPKDLAADLSKNRLKPLCVYTEYGLRLYRHEVHQ